MPDLHNMNAYLTASAYTGLVNNVKDEKILVVYGENDGTVPTWQSTQYVDFAKANNKNVELMNLPGEEHVLRQRSTLTNLCNKIESYFDIPGVSCDAN